MEIRTRARILVVPNHQHVASVPSKPRENLTCVQASHHEYARHGVPILARCVELIECSLNRVGRIPLGLEHHGGVGQGVLGGKAVNRNADGPGVKLSYSRLHAADHFKFILVTRLRTISYRNAFVDQHKLSNPIERRFLEQNRVPISMCVIGDFPEWPGTQSPIGWYG